MSEKRDLRTQKVYDALEAAFIELLQEKPFEKITVRELCERARTRTATFYNHFRDKYEYFSFLINTKRKEFLSRSEALYGYTSPEEFYLTFIRSSMDFISENMSFAENIMSDTFLSVMMSSVSKEELGTLAEHLKKDLDSPASAFDYELLTEMLIGAISEGIRWWLSNRERVSKEYVIDQFAILFQDRLAPKA